MTMPKKLSEWCLVLFFLWYGLSAFVPALMAAPISFVGAVLALGVGVFMLMGR